VDASRRPPGPDPEFDPTPGPTVRLRDFDPLDHQRVLVNPFLAVLALIGVAGLVRRLLLGPFPPLAALALTTLAGVPYLLQYHCLDCGRTGMFLRRQKHACPGVLNRWRDGWQRWSPIPRASSQVVIWIYLIGAAWLLRLVAGLGR